MKKLLIFGIGFIFLLAIPATVFLVGQKQELRKKAAPASTMSLEPKSSTVKIDDTFTLEAILDTADNQIIAAAVQISYDPTKLEVQSITNGPLFSNIISPGIIDNGKASITVSAANTTNPVKGKGTAVTIRFKALTTTSMPTQVTFAQGTFANALGEGEQNALTGTSPAAITISDGTTPLVTQTPSPTVTQSYSRGPSLTPEASPSAKPVESATISATPRPTQQLHASTGENTSTPAAVVNEPSPTQGIIADVPLQILSPNEKVAEASTKPVFKGKATPGSTVTITIYSTPISAVVTVDQNGNWVYTPTTPLEAGPHNIVVSAENSVTGITQNATGSFVIAGPIGGANPNAPIPVAGNAETTIILMIAGILFIATGIILPRVLQ